MACWISLPPPRNPGGRKFLACLSISATLRAFAVTRNDSIGGTLIPRCAPKIQLAGRARPGVLCIIFFTLWMMIAATMMSFLITVFSYQYQ